MTYDLVRTVLCDFKQAPGLPNRQPGWIKRHFSQFGEVVDYKMRRDKRFFWIKFKTPQAADAAVRKGRIFLGGSEGSILVKRKTNLDDGLLKVVKIPKITVEDVVQQLNDYSDDFEEQVHHLKDLILLTTADLQRRGTLITRLEKICRRIIPDALLLPFGSSASGLGFKDSDIDIFLRSEKLKNWMHRPTYEYAMSQLQRVSDEIRRELHMYTQPIPSVRCPIIKIEFSSDFELKPDEGIAVDLNLTNPWGVCNTQLIAILTELEPRFQDLAVVLRYWAKQMGYLGPRFMSSYAFTMLVIFFCQVYSPPLLPPIRVLQDLSPPEVMSMGWNCAFSRDLDAIREYFQQPEEDIPIGQLVCDFFAYYSKLDYQHKYLDLYNGATQWKYNIPEEYEPEFWGKNASHLCAQDPFELSRNVLSNLRGEQNDEFFNTIRNVANWVPLVIHLPTLSSGATSSGVHSMRSDLDQVMEELGSGGSDEDDDDQHHSNSHDVLIIGSNEAKNNASINSSVKSTSTSASQSQSSTGRDSLQGLAKFLVTHQSPFESRSLEALARGSKDGKSKSPTGSPLSNANLNISWQDNCWLPMSPDGFATVMRKQNYQREQAITAWVNALIKAIDTLCVDILELDEFKWLGKWDVIDGRRNLFAEFSALARSDVFKHILRRGTVMEQHAVELDRCFTRGAAEAKISEIIKEEDRLEELKAEEEARHAAAEGRRVKPSKTRLARDRITYAPFLLRVSCVIDCRSDLPQVGMYKLESKGEDLGLANYFRICVIRLSEELVEDLDLPLHQSGTSGTAVVAASDPRDTSLSFSNSTGPSRTPSASRTTEDWNDIGNDKDEEQDGDAAEDSQEVYNIDSSQEEEDLGQEQDDEDEEDKGKYQHTDGDEEDEDGDAEMASQTATPCKTPTTDRTTSQNGSFIPDNKPELELNNSFGLLADLDDVEDVEVLEEDEQEAEAEAQQQRQQEVITIEDSDDEDMAQL